ncbi:hypothetical protein [Paraburkholderia caledonica]|uniref:hypothetical protein n=1 Tax=Paraburkholderia caledonica TaxID=134536 RepID=UPI0038BD6B3B
MMRVNGMPAAPDSATPAAQNDKSASGPTPNASARAPIPAQLAPYKPKREPVQPGAYRDQLLKGPMGVIGKLASPPKPQPAVDDIHDFVPPKGSAGKGVFNAIRQALGSGQKGFTPLNLASKKPLTGVLGANSRAAGGSFVYDAHTAHEIPGMIASGASAVVAHQTTKRYEQKLAAMLREDVLAFDALPQPAPKGIPTNGISSSQQGGGAATHNETQAQTQAPTDDFIATTEPVRTNAPESAAHRTNRYLPTTPENMIVTRQHGEWQYDKPKLLRAANDPAHPQHQRARDVLTTMSIAENQGKRRRGALYESATSATAAAAGAVLAAGTHGAATPLIVAGQSLNAVKDALDIRKFALETRQNLRDEKADDVRRHVTQLASKSEAFDHAPLEAQAGVYANMYDNARRKTAQQHNFGYRLPGSLIDDRKAGVYKTAATDVVSAHIAEIAQKAMRRAQPEKLGQLHETSSEPNLTRSAREKAALEKIEDDPQLRATLTLLTDAGMPRADAVKAMMRLAADALKPAGEKAAEAQAQDPSVMSNDEKLEKIAGMIGEPGLKPADAAKESKDAIKGALRLRS